jgi:hypothetical protein
MGKLEIMMERKTKRMPNPAEAGFFILGVCAALFQRR